MCKTFSSRVRSCQVFAAEQMIRELNKLLFQTKVKEKKVKKKLNQTNLFSRKQTI